jgi:hypothetical protein
MGIMFRINVTLKMRKRMSEFLNVIKPLQTYWGQRRGGGTKLQFPIVGIPKLPFSWRHLVIKSLKYIVVLFKV